MTVVEHLSWAIAGAAVILSALIAVVLRQASIALSVLLDLLLAASLLRLGADDSWSAIAVAAAVIALRHLITRGLVAFRSDRVPERLT